MKCTSWKKSSEHRIPKDLAVMVCDTVIYHPTLAKLINFLDNGAGREKVLRLLQYLSRFLAAQTLSPLAKALQLQFTTVRKFLRFLKPLNNIQNACKLYDNKLTGDGVIRIFSIIRQLSYAAYLTLDQVTLFKILRIVPNTNLTGKKVPRWSNWCWLSALLTGMVVELRQMRISQSRITALAQDEHTEKKLLSKSYKERYTASRKFVWNAIDSFMVLNNLGFLHYQDGYVALAGVFTSLFGVQDTWRAAGPWIFYVRRCLSV